MVIKYAEDNSNLSITATEQGSIANSIGTISSTPYETAPFMRSMGIRNYPPESNSEIARNKYAAEVITQCGIWENRVKVTEVCFGEDNNVRVVIENG
ncbi:MAG: hypothetical protein J6C19_08020 [Lachnospiraceae bacterium]|nr:hypothetical protein [Lachnospiraceae bacterium]MBO5145464.1 hypothetical protein [Lachnospiraceae bacterium]